MSPSDSAQVIELPNEPRSGRPQQPSTPETQDFDYAVLNPEARIVVQNKTSELKRLIYRSAQDIIDIGQKLTEVKEQLGHGNFRAWLKAEFSWSVRTVARFMQVATQFKCANLTHLDIAASALYLLTAPSTSEDARNEALERASLGEAISYARAKVIAAQYKEAAKPKDPEPVSVDVLAETAVRDSFTPAEPHPALQTVESQSAAVVEQSEDKLSEKNTEALAHLQVNNRSHDMVPAIDSGERPPKDQAEIDIQSLFGVGNLIYFTDLGQQESKLLGEVAEVKEVTANGVVIRISLVTSHRNKQR